jgi:serine protease Do
MILQSVVNIALAAIATFLITEQNGIVTPLTRELSHYAESCTLSLHSNGVLLGHGVVISPSGEALVLGESAFGPDGLPRTDLRASIGDKRDVEVRAIAYDPVTDLALVSLIGTTRTNHKYVRIAQSANIGVALISTAEDSFRAEVARVRVAGLLGAHQRYVPLTEIRVESVASVLSGAPVFTSSGELIGLISASLVAARPEVTSSALESMGGTGLVKRGLTDGKALGPQGLVTVFSLDVSVLRRVVNGLLSESRSVKHPWVGLYFGSDPAGGAIITEAVPGGPASLAGIRQGDVIIEAGRHKIRTNLDLATYLFQVEVGSFVNFIVKRGAVVQEIRLRVSSDPQVTHRSLKRDKIRNVVY